MSIPQKGVVFSILVGFLYRHISAVDLSWITVKTQ